MRRREVIMAGGVLGAAAFLEGCGGRERAQIEQVLDRGRTPPGTAHWARSICAQCPGRCELSVRVIDGRAKKIEGDPSSLVSMGGVCALGHSALQGLYLPERPTRPMRRTAGGLDPASWEQALEAIAPRLAARDGALAFCCGPDPVERAVVEAVASHLAASVTVVESPSALRERAATQTWLGADGEIEPSFEQADLLVTLGASPLDRWRNPVAFARRLAEARARGMRWVHVAERMSLSAAKADLWVSPRPRSSRAVVELLNALTLNASSTSDPADLEATIDHASGALDVPRSRLGRLVRWWREAGAAVLIVGAEDLAESAGSEVGEVEAPDPAEMLDRLELARRVDAGPKGTGDMRALGTLPRLRETLAAMSPVERGPSAPVQERTLAELATDCARGVVQTVVALGVDPVASSPRSWGLWDLEPERLVAVSHRVDETARVAGWVLPMQTDLERVQITFSPATDQILLADGVVDPRDEARHPLDVLRALALAGGVEGADLGWEDAENLRERLVEALADLDGGTAARALRGALRADGRLPLRAPGSWRLPLPEPSAARVPAAPWDPVAATPEQPEDALALLIFEAPRGETGAFDRPWIAELPDPVTTVMWGGWIEVAAIDAERFGLSQGAAVEVVDVSDPSRVVASTVYIHPACRPGTAAMPLGVFRGRNEDDGASAIDLVSSGQGGIPGLRAAVRLRAARRTPAPIFGRGLRSAEQIPAGWKAQEHASVDGLGSSTARRPVIALQRPGRSSGSGRPEGGSA